MARGDSDAQRRQVLTGLALAPLLALAVAGRSRADDTELPRLDDLRRLAAQMRHERIPLLLFFGTAGCPYCLEARRNYLAPRLKENVGTLLIREVELTSNRRLIGLDGAPLTEAELAARFSVRIVPVVQLVDASFAPIGRPLVGIDAGGFYEAYLSAAIEEAQQVVRAR